MIRRLTVFHLAPLALGIVFAQKQTDRAFERLPSQQAMLYLWSGEHVRRVSLGFETVMADIYWLRTIQYFGGVKAFARERRFDLLEPLINITVTLDPRFEIAYRYGAVFLCEPSGAGDPEAGIRLLERGLSALPTSWRIRQDLGFFLFYYLKDGKRGARVLLNGARMPGAPLFLETLAADMLGKSKERVTARKIWLRLLEEWPEGSSLKENARVQLRRLDAFDGLDAVNAAIESFRERTGRLPGSLEELGQVGHVPLWDPNGYPWAYSPAIGRASISPKSTLWRAGD